MVFPLDQEEKNKFITEKDLLSKKRSTAYKYLYDDMTTYIDGLYNFYLSTYDFYLGEEKRFDPKILVFWSNHIHYNRMIKKHIFAIIISLIMYALCIVFVWQNLPPLSIILITIVLITILLIEMKNIIFNLNANRLNYIQTAVYYHNEYKIAPSMYQKAKVLFNELTKTIDQLLVITKEDNRNG